MTRRTSAMAPRVRHELDGVIASSGFESGDRIVIGHWHSSPVGAMSDVMWARPGGERVLLAPDDMAAGFISAVYRFDRVEIVGVDVSHSIDRIDVSAGKLAVHLEGGRSRPIPFRRRLPWVTRWIEAPVARAAMGVRTYGMSPTGVREWYRADRYQPVVAGRASFRGDDLGEVAPVDPPCGFGFSEPPRRPSIVTVRPLLHDPSGRLDEALVRLRQGSINAQR